LSQQADFQKISISVLAKSRDYLRRNGNGGSWSYHPGAAPSIEATAWSAIAMRADGETRRQSIDYLMNVQNSDGGWSSEYKFGSSDWNSTLGLLSLRLLSDAEKSATTASPDNKTLKNAVQFLYDDKTNFYSPVGKIIVSILKGSEFLKYPQGWPWTRDTFHWVEPTSYALLALRPLATKDSAESLKRADAFLIDHSCAGGGWNHGDHKPLGVNAEPYPVTTAQALCALQHLPQNPTVQAGLSYLNRMAAEQDSVMTLAWLIMAKDIYKEETVAERQRLAALQNPDGSFGSNVLVTALATCALDIDANPLKLVATQ
jgi:hypothetical protein